jgi:hypothetical protein
MKQFRILAAVAAAMVGTGFLAAPAEGQTQKKKEEIRIDPPTPKKADKAPMIWNFAVAIIIVGAAFAANLIPSKRGHQD